MHIFGFKNRLFLRLQLIVLIVEALGRLGRRNRQTHVSQLSGALVVDVLAQ